MVFENVKIALRAIWANKLRSILTVLGVMIGVGAVIAAVSIVQGMQYKISSDLSQIGSNFFEVFPDPGERRNAFLQKVPELTVDDANAVLHGTTAIRNFSPLFVTTVQTKYGDARHSVQLFAVNNQYQEIASHYVETGRFFVPVDQEAKKAVCTLGRDAAEALSFGANPLGKIIEINKSAFTVVGVMEKKGGSFGNNQDDIVLIPFETAKVIFGSENMKHLVLMFQMQQGADLDLARDQVREILRTRHHLKKGEADDFRIIAQEEIQKTVSSVLTTFTGILAVVVGVGLLVGGIGIMNIMLVSVTERTREIGIRKSIGAMRKHVLLQFLIEAITLSGVGGIIGIAGGYVTAVLVRLTLNHAFKSLALPPVHTPLWAVVLAFLFCAILGVIFGIYPAAKASKLDPIEALRYE